MQNINKKCCDECMWTDNEDGEPQEKCSNKNCICHHPNQPSLI